MQNKDFQIGKYYKTKCNIYINPDFTIPANSNVIYLGLNKDGKFHNSIKLLYFGFLYKFTIYRWEEFIIC